jgi:hypothetical protein
MAQFEVIEGNRFRFPKIRKEGSLGDIIEVPDELAEEAAKYPQLKRIVQKDDKKTKKKEVN